MKVLKMKTVKNITIYLLLVLCSLALLGCKQKANEDEPISEAKADATGNKVIITGQLVKKDGSPVPYAYLGVHEFKDGKVTLKFGDGGIFLNPTCEIYKEAKGRFKLELDLDVFKEAEEFVILARLSKDPFDQGVPLRNRNGNLITFEFSEGIKDLDLDQIVVE